MYKVNNKDTRITSFDVFLVSFMLTLNRFTPRSSVSIAEFEQVNAQWVEGSIILVGNDVLPRKLQLKHFCNMLSNCMMSKTRAVTKICGCAELTDTLNTRGKRFIMIIIMLRYSEFFTSYQGSMGTFSKHYSKCETVSIKFSKNIAREETTSIKIFTG